MRQAQAAPANRARAAQTSEHDGNGDLEYAAHKLPGLKAKTQEKYDNLTRLYRKLGDLTIDEPLIVKQKLEQVTTIYRTKDGLMYLAAACRWGKKHKLVAANPFEGMAQELSQYRYQVDPKPMLLQKRNETR